MTGASGGVTGASGRMTGASAGMTGASGGMTGASGGNDRTSFSKMGGDDQLLLAVVLDVLDIASRSSLYSGLTAPDAPAEF